MALLSKEFLIAYFGYSDERIDVNRANVLWGGETKQATMQMTNKCQDFSKKTWPGFGTKYKNEKLKNLKAFHNSFRSGELPGNPFKVLDFSVFYKNENIETKVIKDVFHKWKMKNKRTTKIGGAHT